MVVLGRMLVLGRIAAPHVAAAEAKPQMNPAISHFLALFADMFIGIADFDLIEMGASICHGGSPGKSIFNVK